MISASTQAMQDLRQDQISVSDICFLISRTVPVVLRRIAVFLLSNVIFYVF